MDVFEGLKLGLLVGSLVVGVGTKDGFTVGAVGRDVGANVGVVGE